MDFLQPRTSAKKLLAFCLCMGISTFSMILPAGEEDTQQVYEPTRESLATHEIPDWWNKGKFGIFIHWGPYAVPGFGTAAPKFLVDLGIIPAYMNAEWYALQQAVPFSPAWFKHLFKFGPDVKYDDFLPQFTAENFDANDWIDLFESAGAKYFVLTSKHHDGFALWPSEVTGRNSSEIGAKRDLVGELFEASQGKDIKPGLYYSLPEFFNPAPMPNPRTVYKNTGGNRWAFGYKPWDPYRLSRVGYAGQPSVDDYAADIILPQIRELIHNYMPALLWCDIGGSSEYFQSNSFIAEYYNTALVTRPEGVLVNSRCGDNAHSDYGVVEQGGGFADEADPSNRTETARTMGESWGYDRNEDKPNAHVRSARELIVGLIQAVASNSNYLLNIGPRADGTIPEWQRERLLAIGAWLQVNGEAIYNTRPWLNNTDREGNYFTFSENGNGYIIATTAQGNQLTVKTLPPVNENTIITLIGGDGSPLTFYTDDDVLRVDLPISTENVEESTPIALRVDLGN